MTNVPAKQQENKKVAPSEVEKGTGRMPKRGMYYLAKDGSYVPDANRIQEESNDFKISVEILEKITTDKYVEVSVRGHHPDGYYIDSTVRHEFGFIGLKLVMGWYKRILAGGHVKFGPKNKQRKIEPFRDMNQPFIGDEFGNAKPNLTPIGQACFVDQMLDKRIYGLRTCTTNAMAIVQKKLTNQDWREDAEIKMEEEEVKKINNQEEVIKKTQEEVDAKNEQKGENAKKREKTVSKKTEEKKQVDDKKGSKTDEVKTKKTTAKKTTATKKDTKKVEDKKAERREEIKQDDGSILERPKDTGGEVKKDNGYDVPNYKGASGLAILENVIDISQESGEEMKQINISKRLLTLKREKHITNKQYAFAKEEMLKYFTEREKNLNNENKEE